MCFFLQVMLTRLVDGHKGLHIVFPSNDGHLYIIDGITGKIACVELTTGLEVSYIVVSLIFWVCICNSKPFLLKTTPV